MDPHHTSEARHKPTHTRMVHEAHSCSLLWALQTRWSSGVRTFHAHKATRPWGRSRVRPEGPWACHRTGRTSPCARCRATRGIRNRRAAGRGRCASTAIRGAAAHVSGASFPGDGGRSAAPAIALTVRPPFGHTPQLSTAPRSTPSRATPPCFPRPTPIRAARRGAGCTLSGSACATLSAGSSSVASGAPEALPSCTAPSTLLSTPHPDPPIANHDVFLCEATLRPRTLWRCWSPRKCTS
jgi:hypothetical protein